VGECKLCGAVRDFVNSLERDWTVGAMIISGRKPSFEELRDAEAEDDEL
jgi:hypothetical protein